MTQRSLVQLCFKGRLLACFFMFVRKWGFFKTHLPLHLQPLALMLLWCWELARLDEVCRMLRRVRAGCELGSVGIFSKLVSVCLKKQIHWSAVALMSQIPALIRKVFFNSKPPTLPHSILDGYRSMLWQQWYQSLTVRSEIIKKERRVSSDF